MKINRRVVTTTTTRHEVTVEIPHYCCAGMRHLMGYIGVGHRYLSVPYSYSPITAGMATGAPPHHIVPSHVESCKELKDFPMRFCPFCGEEIEEEEDREYVVVEGKDESETAI